MTQTAVQEPEDGEQEGTFEFDPAFQVKIASMFLRDTTFAQQTKDLLKPEYFADEAVAAVVATVQKHVTTYKSAPGLKLLPMLIKDEVANKRIRKDMMGDITTFVKAAMREDLANMDFVVDKVSEFARRSAVEQAFMSSIPLIEKGNWEEIEKRMKAALSIGAIKEGGNYNYWDEISNRTQVRRDVAAGKIIKNGISTGYKEIDAYLYHLGWGRKELSVMMGAAKAGKSLSLGDFTKNASLLGFNTIYVSLEVSRDIISQRLDAAISDTMIAKLHLDPDEVDRRIKAASAKAGALEMRDYPSGTLKPSQLHRMLEKYKSDGMIFDLITVDYADIMAAEYRSDKLTDNLREIYIDLRAIAHEFNAALLTATQTNRDGAKAMTAKATDVGDDWNKIRTADIVIGINASDAEKKAGEARLYWAISRNTEDGFTLRIKQDRSKMQFLTKVIGRE